MGKRKRTGTSSSATFHPSPSDSMPCSSGRDLTSGEQTAYDPDNNSIFKPSVKEIMDNHGKQPNSQLSLAQHHHHNLSRSLFLKRSRHHYGNQYSRRNLSNYHKPSTSYGKNSPFNDERLCFKLGSRYNSDMGHRPDFTEFRERSFWQPEKIRSSPSFVHAVSPEGVRMTCLICQKLLRRKAHHFGSTLASDQEPSIVAVLVCGHVFHGDCLEQRTRLEDKRDPPCPICTRFVPKAEVTDLG